MTVSGKNFLAPRIVSGSGDGPIGVSKLWNRPWAMWGFMSLLVLAISLFISHLSGRPIIAIDDADIFFVYARNLAGGHGFVYNIGGERVEGCTSLLWVLLLTPFFLVSATPDKLVFLLDVFLVSLALGNLCRCVRSYLARRQEDKNQWVTRSLVGLFLLTLLASPEFFSWSVHSLMDVGLWFFLNIQLFITLFAIVTKDRVERRDIVGLSILGAFMVLARPEALMLVPIAYGLLLVWLARRDGLRQAVAQLWPAWLAFLFSAVGLTIFRLAYFGYPFHNTYYAKVSPDHLYNLRQGYDYYIGFIKWNPLSGFFCLATGAGVTALVLNIIFRRRAGMATPGGECDAIGFAALLPAIGLALPFITGGDHFGAFRLYQPFWCLMILPPLLGVDLLMRRNISQRVKVFSLGLAGLLLLAGAGMNWRVAIINHGSIFWNEFVVSVNGRLSGRMMSEVATRIGQTPAVGVIWAGGFALAYHGPVFDLMGLNHVAMAHAPGNRYGGKGHAAFNPTVFWAEPPAVMLPEAVTERMIATLPGRFSRLPDFANGDVLHGLTRDARFEQRYIRKLVQLPENANSGLMLLAYFQRDIVDLMKQRGLTLRDLPAS